MIYFASMHREEVNMIKDVWKKNHQCSKRTAAQIGIMGITTIIHHQHVNMLFAKLFFNFTWNHDLWLDEAKAFFYSLSHNKHTTMNPAIIGPFVLSHYTSPFAKVPGPVCLNKPTPFTWAIRRSFSTDGKSKNPSLCWNPHSDFPFSAIIADKVIVYHLYVICTGFCKATFLGYALTAQVYRFHDCCLRGNGGRILVGWL